MTKRLRCLLFALAMSGGLGCAAMTAHRPEMLPVQTVQRVDLERYMGTWYEIAHFPQPFEEGCTATYELRDDGAIDVVNRCRKYRFDGPEDSAHDGIVSRIAEQGYDTARLVRTRQPPVQCARRR